MIWTQVSLEEKMYRKALDEAKRQGISFAEFCRRALARMLRHRSDGLPHMRYAGIIEDAGPDASQRVDEVVYGREGP
jgi:hypothetical protein